MHTGLHSRIDIYCERVGPEFWAEPLNALSNGSFILAALWAGWLAARSQLGAPDIWALIVLAFLIGVGSFLFHTYATVWSAMADVIPIWIFVVLFTLSALHRIAGIRLLRIALGTGALIAVIAALIVVFGENGGAEGSATSATAGSDLLNGSQQYAPALIALMVFSLISWRRQNPMAPWIWATTATFFLSLMFRTLDIHLCGIWPMGTHFLWHLLNGLMIGTLLDGYIRLQSR